MKAWLFCTAVTLSALVAIVARPRWASSSTNLSMAEMQNIRGAEGCTACHEEWVTMPGTMNQGGIECEHGPDNDPNDCGGPPIDIIRCWELNGHANNPWDDEPLGDGKCKCFECGAWSTTCAHWIEVYLAWC